MIEYKMLYNVLFNNSYKKTGVKIMFKKKIAFAGFRHSHILVLYDMVKESDIFDLGGAFELDENAKNEYEEKGVNFTYNSYEELLNDETVNTVAIGDYYANRGNLALKALESGKNVICDKPLCTSLDELEKIEFLAKEKGLYVSCMFTMRYEGITESAKEAMELIGEVKSVYFGGQHPLMFSQRPSWYFEDGKYGGLFNDIAIHGVDLIYYLTGQRIKETTCARCYNAYAEKAPEFPDSGQFMAKLDNGAGIIADVSYATPMPVGYSLPFYWQFFIWGEKGVAKFSINSDGVECFVEGNPEAVVIPKKKAPVSYLEDFNNLISGKKALLPMEDSIESTRETLTVEKLSYFDK